MRMNFASAAWVVESDGTPIPSRTRRKFKIPDYACPELENVGLHIYDESQCRYCGNPG